LDVKLSSNEQRASQEAEDKLRNVGNLTDLSSWARRKSGKIFGRGFIGHQELLRSDPRRRRPLDLEC